MSRSRKRRVPHSAALIALVLAGLTLGPAWAQPLTLRVLGPTQPISPYAITGFNVGVAMAVALHLDEFGALTMRSLRFPPGNDADDRPLSRDTMNAFVQSWHLLGEPEMLIVTNFFEGPEHAVEVSRHLDALGVDVRWWAVGNEPDLYARNRMDPAWTAEVYCQRYRVSHAALKAERPDALMTGPAVSGSRPDGLAFLREVLGRCGDVIDVLTWHVYPTDGTWSDEDALATSRVITDEIRQVRAWLRDPAVNPLGFERDIGLAITEFGLSWRTTNFRHLEDMVAALWLAEALGQMATLGLDLGHYFALQSMGGHGLIARGGWVRHTYHVYAMLADFGGHAYAVEGGDERLGAYAAGDEHGLRVLLVNRSSDAIDVTLAAEDLADTLQVATLDDVIFDEELGYRRSLQPSTDTVAVPPRSVVVVTSLP